jgi:hypothetical protein
MGLDVVVDPVDLQLVAVALLVVTDAGQACMSTLARALAVSRLEPQAELLTDRRARGRCGD